MKKYIYFLLCNVIFISLFSCTPTDPTAADSIFPIKNGNYWLYVDTNYICLNPPEIKERSREIGQMTKVTSYDGFLIDSGGDKHAKFYGINDKDGNFVTLGGVSDTDTLFSPSVMFKNNVKKGDKYMFGHISFSYDGTMNQQMLEMQCISADTLINVPAGRFICQAYKYTPTNGDDWIYYYLSKNVGIIKTVSYELKNKRNSSVLKSYQIQ